MCPKKIGRFLLLSLFFFTGCEKEYKWFDTFSTTGEEPYDVSLLYQLIHKKAQKVIPLKSKLSNNLDTTLQDATYLFIGSEYYFDTADWRKLEQFVKDGNIAIFITSYVSFIKRDSLTPPIEFSTYNDSIIRVSLDTSYINPSNSFTITKRNEKRGMKANFQYASYLANDFYYPMGWLYEEKCNFWRYPQGKGAFVFHTTPLCFTNYALDTEEGYQYCSNALSKILKNKVLWDEYSGTEVARMMANNPKRNTLTPLVFILSQPALRWAWFVFLAGIVLYLIFGAKRRQRPIPVWNKPGNMALGFIKNVGALYLEEKSFKALAMMEIKSFYAFMLERFKMSPLEIHQESTIKRLEEQTKVKEKTWRDIFRQITIIQNADQITEADLHRVYKATEDLKKELT